MSRTAARFNQADIARATRAAMQAGAGSVRLLLDGTIRIDLQAEPLGESRAETVEHEVEIRL